MALCLRLCLPRCRRSISSSPLPRRALSSSSLTRLTSFSSGRSRIFFPLGFRSPNTTVATSLFSTSTSTAALSSSPSFSILPFANCAAAAGGRDVALVSSTFKEWFKTSRPYTLFDSIFDALATHTEAGDAALDRALSALHLRLDEALVIQVLHHSPSPSSVAASIARDPGSAGCADAFLLLRLKFFDWAGHQHGFQHTRATYHTIFRLLSRARLMSVVIDRLVAFAATRHGSSAGYLHRRHVRFHDILVVGYAVVGRPEVALEVFGQMRFQGLDLDAFSYHVLLNSLVEESAFDVADTIFSQISARGLDNHFTSSIRMKSLCKQNRLDEAVAFMKELAKKGLDDDVIKRNVASVLIDALCKQQRFEEASKLVEEFGTAHTYDVWLGGLVDARRTNNALDFLYTKKESEDYIPNVFFYNKLIYQLLRENQLEEVYEILIAMRDDGITPDKVTMNSVLCFFCKAGMVDVALMLYKSRAEFGLSPNHLAYNHLISALCTKEDVNEVYEILEESLKHGYSPGKRVFHMLATMLCQKGQLDKMGKLLNVAFQMNSTPMTAACSIYIAALCNAGKLEEAYTVLQKVAGAKNMKKSYTSLIRGYAQHKRGNMICKLLMEMQDNGHLPNRSLYREIICCLCDTGDYDQVLNLLETQLTRKETDPRTCYHHFIYGAGHAKKYELALEVFQRMGSAKVEPNVDTNVLMLVCYLKSHRISDAINFFYDIYMGREPSNKMYNILIVGLCRAQKLDQALCFWREVRGKGLIPSLNCYEELVHAFCSARDYHNLVKILKDFEETGRQVSSFICNLLLLHTLKSSELSRTWHMVGVHDKETMISDRYDDSLHSGRLMLGQLVSAFSGGIKIKERLDCLEEVVEKYFPVDTFTYNMLLRALTMAGRMDYACQLFDRICKKGHQPNRYTYDIILHGFCKHGRKKEATILKDEMLKKGFYPTLYTIDLYNRVPA